MKTAFLKTSLPIVLVTLLFTACKKDKDDNGPASADDLNGYYIVGEIGGAGTNSLFTLYFQRNSDGITATYDMSESRRAAPVILDNGQYTFDVNSNGTQVFTFEYKKENGVVRLVNSNYASTSSASLNIQAIVMANGGDAASFAGKTFRQVASPNSYIKFSTDNKWDWLPTGSFTAYTRSYYNIGTPVMGWKAEGDYMGIMVPSWKNEGPGMIVQRLREPLVFFREQQ